MNLTPVRNNKRDPSPNISINLNDISSINLDTSFIPTKFNENDMSFFSNFDLNNEIGFKMTFEEFRNKKMDYEFLNTSRLPKSKKSIFCGRKTLVNIIYKIIYY